MIYRQGGDWDVLMLLRLSALTGEDTSYSQIITIGSSLFTQFSKHLLCLIKSFQHKYTLYLSSIFQRQIIFSSTISYAQHQTQKK